MLTEVKLFYFTEELLNLWMLGVWIEICSNCNYGVCIEINLNFTVQNFLPYIWIACGESLMNFPAWPNMTLKMMPGARVEQLLDSHLALGHMSRESSRRVGQKSIGLVVGIYRDQITLLLL